MVQKLFGLSVLAMVLISVPPFGLSLGIKMGTLSLGHFNKRTLLIKMPKSELLLRYFSVHSVPPHFMCQCFDFNTFSVLAFAIGNMNSSGFHFFRPSIFMTTSSFTIVSP